MRRLLEENKFTCLVGLVFLVGYSLPGSAIESVRKANSIFNYILADHLLHFYTFGIFAFVLGWERGKVSKFYGRQWFAVGAVALGYGLFIEFYQLFLPYRGTQLGDIGWDVLGIALGLSLAYGFLRWRKKTNPRRSR
ncbi:MAG: VanZ family protein [Candidatus Aminicenantes bacterium]|nr:VanZ family protein [Candidatus Aminicenantes bacterium]